METLMIASNVWTRGLERNTLMGVGMSKGGTPPMCVWEETSILNLKKSASECTP